MKPRDPAWKPVDYDDKVIQALKALSLGEADPAQQGKALNWIINNCAGTYELSFRSDSHGGDRETAFAEGRRFVGMQIVKLINMAPAVVGKMRDNNG